MEGSLLPTPYSLLLTPYSLLLTPYSPVDSLPQNAAMHSRDGVWVYAYFMLN